MHIAHIRGAVFGDVLSSLYTKTGFDVTREYYVNDAGSQIDKLSNSLLKRYLQLFEKSNHFDEELYNNHKLIENKIIDKVKDAFNPEFINRLDDCIVYHTLSPEKVIDIIDIQLEDLTENLKVNLGFRLSMYQHIGPFTRYYKNPNTGVTDSTREFGSLEPIKTYFGPEPRFSARYLFKNIHFKCCHTWQTWLLILTEISVTPKRRN